MGQAASQARFYSDSTISFPRPRGGSRRSATQCAGFAALFVSGLYLWLWPQTSLILWCHILCGLLIVSAVAPWILRHIPTGLASSQRRSFTLSSWALLVCFVTVLLTGLAMSAAAFVWLAGGVWFMPREVTEILSLLHFWGSWLALPGLVVHLAMRHWVRKAR